MSATADIPGFPPSREFDSHEMTRRFSATAVSAAVATVLVFGGVASAQPALPGQQTPVDGAPADNPSTDTEPTEADPIETGPVGSAPLGESEAGAPSGAGEDLAELSRLSEDAGALGEELHLAREELNRLVADRDRLERAAGIAAALATTADGTARRDQSVVDHLATMRYRGGDTGPTRAAVLAESPRDLVHRLDALRRLSGATTNALDASQAASAEAARLREEAAGAAEAARAAADEARDRTADLDRRSEEMQTRMDEVRRRVDALSESQRALWAGGPVVPDGYVAPPVDGVNSAALRTALTRLGAPYSWGATGPSQFDCSGLMVWSYAQEGKSLPRSSQAQAVSGAPVAPADMQPGDLVIYYPGATHVGMYAGDGLVLHAPTYGVPVKLEKVDAMPISGIRRY